MLARLALLTFFVASLHGGVVYAQDVDRQLEDLKQMVVEINSDLASVEQQLLFPIDTQLMVLVALEADNAFRLDSVALRLNGTVLSNYLYSEAENAALRRGGIQRLYLGNLKPGKYTLQAELNGVTAAGSAFRETSSLDLEKAGQGRYVEFRVLIKGKAADVTAKVW